MARIAMGPETDECDLTLLYSICKTMSSDFAKFILFFASKVFLLSMSEFEGTESCKIGLEILRFCAF